MIKCIVFHALPLQEAFGLLIFGHSPLELQKVMITKLKIRSLGVVDKLRASKLVFSEHTST